MTKHLIEILRRCQGFGNSGSAAVEFAVILPVLMLLVLGTADYGVLMGGAASLEGATRAGAEYAKSNPSDTTGIQTQVCVHLGLTFDGTSCTPVTPGVAVVCTCVDNTVVTPCPPATSTTPCAGKTNSSFSPPQPDQRVFQYVSVTAARTFNPIVSYTGFFTNLSLTGETRIRTQ
jgi:Flp pilus assembly protein TadG